MLSQFCCDQYPVDTIFLERRQVDTIFLEQRQLILFITCCINLHNLSGPPFPDHFEALPNQFHCGQPLEGWSMPHRRSKYPPDSRQTMEPPVSNGGGMPVHISFCPCDGPLGSCHYFAASRISNICCESNCFLFSCI